MTYRKKVVIISLSFTVGLALLQAGYPKFIIELLGLMLMLTAYLWYKRLNHPPQVRHFGVLNYLKITLILMFHGFIFIIVFLIVRYFFQGSGQFVFDFNIILREILGSHQP